MVIAQLGCCAFNEIRGLCGYARPIAAMRAFCEHQLPMFGRRRLGAFYLFTAVVKSTAAMDTAGVGPYGNKFAEVIKEHKLGEVTPTMTRVNRRNVRCHHVQGWIWAPSEAGLKKWWKKNGGASVQ